MLDCTGFCLLRASLFQKVQCRIVQDFWRVFFCLALACSSIVFCREKCLRAIFVGDTESNLREPIACDLSACTKFCEYVAKELDRLYVPVVISGPMLSYKAVYDAVSAKENENADILLFYFSGHGFRDGFSLVPWPLLHVSATNEAICSESVVTCLSQHNARLTIVFFDCCNSFLKSTLYKKKLVAPVAAGPFLEELFLKTSGLIVASASSPGYPSYAFLTGSLFTQEVIKTFLESKKEPFETWVDFFEQVSFRCKNFQVPYVELMVKN